LLPDLAPGVRLRHAHERWSSVEADGHVAVGEERGEVAAGTAAEVEDPLTSD
jgi:hypothetical protein